MMPDPLPLIPWPQHLEPGQGVFSIHSDTRIVAPADPAWQRLGDYLAEQLHAAVSLHLSVGAAAGGSGEIAILQTPSDPALGEEGYRLLVEPDGVRLEAAQPAGAFYGLQTFLHALSPHDRRLPALSIQDAPRYAWRGMMLDVARHFFPLPVIKQLIDWLAAYKFNRLHLHLSDDQGWRIEVKSWPRLAEIGGGTAVGGGAGGYYTQADYRHLADYAASRFITLVPEIDMPGHTNAALAAYAELNCDGQAPDLYTGMEVGFSSLCIDKEVTYRFIEDVLGELAGLTPGAWLHIGADEAHSTPPEQYRQFIERVAGIVADTGKHLVAYQEAARAQLSEGALLQYWDERIPFEPPTGTQMILSPASKAYLDMKYAPDSPLGLEWAGHIGVRQAYDWDTVALLPNLPAGRIAGVEAPLWSETIRTQAELETLLFPRLPGYGEIAWSPAAARQWPNYRSRLAQHALRWTAQGISYFSSPEID